jgi:hypothetical protein
MHDVLTVVVGSDAADAFLQVISACQCSMSLILKRHFSP